MSNIIDKIRLSGTDYTLSATTSGVSVVEVTQAEYDALPSSAKTDTSKMYVITDAEAGDLTNYYTKTETNTLLGGKADTATTYTKTEVDNAITAATSTKQDTLVSGTNIKTINNTSILGSGNINIQGGGGKAVSGGTNISITTGETADTINCTLPITAGTGENSIVGNIAQNTASGKNALALGGFYNSQSSYGLSVASGLGSVSFGGNASGEQSFAAASMGSTASGQRSATIAGYSNNSKGVESLTSGRYVNAENIWEFSFGYANVSHKANNTWGDSGNTLFSVGNGTSPSARHNAFEIRQNGDIYISSGGTDIKLQDYLGGGGSGTVSSAITSGDTNAVAGGAVFDAVVYSGSTYTTELTFDANEYAENWIVGQSAITIDVSGYTSDTSADYHFQNSNGENLGYAHIYKTIGFWGGNWNNDANNCTITTDGDTATTATITDIPSGTVKIRRMGVINPPKAIISGDTPETWIKDALDDHRDNTTVHITAAERTYWNNKSNFSGSYNDLTDKPIPDSALNVASTNPVQNQALYNELRLSDGGEAETTIEWSGNESTNYPNGCTKIKVEDITSMSQNTIHFFADGGPLGDISVSNWGSISVDTSNFQGATYEISGSTVIISYPTVTTVTRLDISDSTKYTYKAITSSTTPLKDQVVANTTALGGLKLVKLTQAQYDALVTKDSNTLYVIVN